MADPHANDDAWFAPKRFGYGAGLPIAWQGWALLAGYLALVILPVHYLLPAGGAATRISVFALIALATGLLVIVSKHKTRGGWRWRWNERD